MLFVIVFNKLKSEDLFCAETSVTGQFTLWWHFYKSQMCLKSSAVKPFLCDSISCDTNMRVQSR